MTVLWITLRQEAVCKLVDVMKNISCTLIWFTATGSCRIAIDFYLHLILLLFVSNCFLFISVPVLFDIFLDAKCYDTINGISQMKWNWIQIKLNTHLIKWKIDRNKTKVYVSLIAWPIICSVWPNSKNSAFRVSVQKMLFLGINEKSWRRFNRESDFSYEFEFLFLFKIKTHLWICQQMDLKWCSLPWLDENFASSVRK